MSEPEDKFNDYFWAIDEDERSPVPDGYNVEQWRKADELFHVMSLIADDIQCINILYDAFSKDSE